MSVKDGGRPWVVLGYQGPAVPGMYTDTVTVGDRGDKYSLAREIYLDTGNIWFGVYI